MKELISKPEVFNYGKLGKIRGLVVNKEPWFVAKDVCNTLGYKNISGTIEKHVDDDEKGIYPIYTLGGKQKTLIINEKGLFKLIFKTRNLSQKKKELIIEQFRTNGFLINYPKVCISYKEINFGEKLIDALKPFAFIVSKQYICLGYKIDFYIESINIAIEYDENDHKYYDEKDQEIRQKNIEEYLKCDFIRVSENYSDEYNIGYVIKSIYEILNNRK